MGASHTPAAAPASRGALEAALADAGGTDPRWWSNAPGDTYARHDHAYHKVLFCAQGSIVFHTDDGDIALEAGDRLEIEPGTAHAATVGAQGVTCVEAPLTQA